MEDKKKKWMYVKQVKPRHGIAACLEETQSPLRGQAFCFLPLPVSTGLPVHVNGHFILNSTRRNLWSATDTSEMDDRSRWNQYLLEGISSSYAHFLKRVREWYPRNKELKDKESIEKEISFYYKLFPKYEKCAELYWSPLAKQVFLTMAKQNSPILAVTAKVSSDDDDNYEVKWDYLDNSDIQIIISKIRLTLD